MTARPISYIMYQRTRTQTRCVVCVCKLGMISVVKVILDSVVSIRVLENKNKNDFDKKKKIEYIKTNEHSGKTLKMSLIIRTTPARKPNVQNLSYTIFIYRFFRCSVFNVTKTISQIVKI